VVFPKPALSGQEISEKEMIPEDDEAGAVMSESPTEHKLGEGWAAFFDTNL
jgi:hypothetical protein